jgi:hypothetical protein
MAGALLGVVVSGPVSPAAAQVTADSTLADAHRAVSGCYAVELGPWQDLESTDPDEPYYRIASRIRLDTVTARLRNRPRPGWFSVYPNQGVQPDEAAHWMLEPRGEPGRRGTRGPS